MRPKTLRRLALGALLVAAPSTARPQGPPMQGPALPPAAAPPAFLYGFEPEGKYGLWIDGEEAKGATVHMSRREGSLFLLQHEALEAGVLLRPKDKMVLLLAAGAVQEQMDLTITLKNEPPATEVGVYSITEDGIQFAAHGHAVVLKQGPILVGEQQGPELLAKDAGYSYRAQTYVPSSLTLTRLRATKAPVRVRVFFATWCGACSQKLPRLLRVARDLGPSPLQFEYVGMPHKFTEYDAAKEFDIKSIPTAVLLKGPDEIGRLKGRAWLTPEKGIADLLEKASLL